MIPSIQKAARTKPASFDPILLLSPSLLYISTCISMTTDQRRVFNTSSFPSISRTSEYFNYQMGKDNSSMGIIVKYSQHDEKIFKPRFITQHSLNDFTNGNRLRMISFAKEVKQIQSKYYHMSTRFTHRPLLAAPSTFKKYTFLESVLASIRSICPAFLIWPNGVPYR